VCFIQGRWEFKTVRGEFQRRTKVSGKKKGERRRGFSFTPDKTPWRETGKNYWGISISEKKLWIGRKTLKP